MNVIKKQKHKVGGIRQNRNIVDLEQDVITIIKRLKLV